MSAHRLFGVETEYAVTAIDRQGQLWAPAVFSSRLLDRARRRFAHLPATDTGLFLANGSRLYVDYGDHPEIGSPECLDPWDAVRYARAGDRIMVQLAQDVERAHAELADTIVRTGNVDYSGSGASWGAHESYCHRARPEILQRRLVPHLVSRVVYAGAGGFNPFSHGIEFMLSPRASHITCVTSGESTRQRGIIHTRNEPLAAHGYLRQHVLCGESLRSDRAAWLRVGATALVVAMIEAGIPCGDEVALESLDALMIFARDIGCRRTVLTAAGSLTAVQIQRRYLQRAVEHLDAQWMPTWAGEVCARWDQMLTRLEQGPDAVRTTLDWAIKLAVFRDRSRRWGFDWNRLAPWTRVADTLERARREGPSPSEPLSAALVQSSRHLRSAVAAADPLVTKHRLKLADLDRFLALRQDLFEVDVRFGQLGSRSVFEALDRAGVLDHHVPGIDRIDEAVEQPPADGRAHVRGKTIRQAAAHAKRYSCTWDQVMDHQTGAYLDLSDPFAGRAMWQSWARDRASPPVPPAAPEAGDLRVISRLIGLLRTGRSAQSRSDWQGD
jgi:proteasome accessory factor A